MNNKNNNHSYTHNRKHQRIQMIASVIFEYKSNIKKLSMFNISKSGINIINDFHIDIGSVCTISFEDTANNIISKKAIV